LHWIIRNRGLISKKNYPEYQTSGEWTALVCYTNGHWRIVVLSYKMTVIWETAENINTGVWNLMFVECVRPTSNSPVPRNIIISF